MQPDDNLINYTDVAVERRRNHRTNEEKIAAIIEDYETRELLRHKLSSEHKNDVDSETKGSLERHAQTILIALITGALAFTANFVYSSNESLGKIQLQVDYLSKSMIKLEAKIEEMSSRYVDKTAFDAVINKMEIVHEKQEARIDQLAQKINRN